MKKIKILSVFGTRPEAIKMCPLVKALEVDERFESRVCVTGQHRELLNQVLDIFHVVPSFNLDIMQNNQTLSMITVSVLKGMERVLKEYAPDYVLVQGDTTSGFATALAAFYSNIHVGHIEAGLRTYNKHSPYPEEINRQLISRIAHMHFAPTQKNKEYLLNENIIENVFVTGNTGIDALSTTIKENYVFKNETLQGINKHAKIVLLTAHRRENWGTPLINICNAILRLSNKYPELLFVYPVHPNPIVSDTVHALLGKHSNIILTNPLDVEDIHNLLSKCWMVMTDSGGIQEEAPHLGKPVIVLRTETERSEAVTANTSIVAGIETNRIVDTFEHIYNDHSVYNLMAQAYNPYGDGHSSQRIVDAIHSVAMKDNYTV